MQQRLASLTVAAFAAAIALMDTTQAVPATFFPCLQNIKSNTKSYLITQFSTAYETDRLLYDRNFDFKPIAIYHPATEADAAAAIQCAAASGIAVAPRSGGHSFEGYSGGGRDGSLIIDLNLFQQFSIDHGTGIATIGAGTRLGPLYTKLWDAGEYLVPGGTCATVGIGGLALGGGLGMVGRKYGMLTDNIVGMTMIEAQGNVLQVSATSNSDLFWALRGAGGGSFGLVTEFRIQAYKAPPTVTTMLIHWPLSKYRDVIQAYGHWGGDGQGLPEDLFAAMHFGLDIEFQINFLGPKAEALAVVTPLLKAVGEPSRLDIKEGNWLEAATLWAVRSGLARERSLGNPDLSAHRYHRGRSILYRQPMSIEEMDVIYKYLSNPPEASSKVFIIIDFWGGKIDRPSHPAAFDNHRGVFYSIDFGMEWKDVHSRPGTNCSECLTWSANFARDMHAAYSSGPSLEAYQNYIERDLPDALHAYYGHNLPRLMEIKRMIDPNNVFSFPQSIPLSNSTYPKGHVVFQ